jgi:hypothetical protein
MQVFVVTVNPPVELSWREPGPSRPAAETPGFGVVVVWLNIQDL